MFGTIMATGASVLNKGGEVISQVGSKVQAKLDESGVSQNVSYYVNKGAETTVSVGSKIMETTASTYEQAKANPKVNDLTEKSK